jgi:hypothetical protein
MRYYQDNVFVWALLQKPRNLQYHALLPRQRVCVGTFTKTTPLTVSCVITKTRVIHTVTQAHKTYTFEQLNFIQGCFSVMSGTLHHFEGYKTLGSEIGTSLINRFTFNVSYI